MRRDLCRKRGGIEAADAGEDDRGGTNSGVQIGWRRSMVRSEGITVGWRKLELGDRAVDGFEGDDVMGGSCSLCHVGPRLTVLCCDGSGRPESGL